MQLFLTLRRKGGDWKELPWKKGEEFYLKPLPQS